MAKKVGFPLPQRSLVNTTDDWLDLPDGAIVDRYFDNLYDDPCGSECARAAQLISNGDPFGFLVSPESVRAVDSLLHFCD